MDGREASPKNSYEICSIISQLAGEKINPGNAWSANQVKWHFQPHIALADEKKGWIIESAEVVLNRIFSQA